MMFTNTRNAAAILASAALVSAQTPADFIPGTDTGLVVAFGTTGAMGGVVVDINTTQTQPTVALLTPATSQNLAILMIDIDIPAQFNPDGPNTVLHWLQTNVTAAAIATTLMLDTGMVQGYVLDSIVEPLAAYNGPAPPALAPLSHRYTQVVLDMEGVDAAGLQMLADAAVTRLGFDAATVLAAAGFTADDALAGNFFNVTNPGPIEGGDGNTGNGTGTGAGAGGDDNVPDSIASSTQLGLTMALGLGFVAGAFLGL